MSPRPIFWLNELRFCSIFIYSMVQGANGRWSVFFFLFFPRVLLHLAYKTHKAEESHWFFACHHCHFKSNWSLSNGRLPRDTLFLFTSLIFHPTQAHLHIRRQGRDEACILINHLQLLLPLPLAGQELCRATSYLISFVFLNSGILKKTLHNSLAWVCESFMGLSLFFSTIDLGQCWRWKHTGIRMHAMALRL